MGKSFYKNGNAVVVDGAALSLVRVARKMSMAELAERLGCNRCSISRWEQGSLVPSEDRIKKMVEIFGTNSFVRVNPDHLKARRKTA